jgi:CRISPR-associated protein Cmr6
LWLGEKHPKRDRKTQPKDMRHASPVHYHLAKGADGKLVIRVIAFPSPVLPDIEISRKVLGELLAYLKTDLERRARECLERAPTSPRRAGIPQAGGFRGRDAAPPVRHAPPPPPAPALPRANQNVDAVLIEKKTSKGGWKARHEASGLAGPVQNSAEVPAESKPGDKVTLVVAYARPGDIAFRWPKPSGEQKGTRK